MAYVIMFTHTGKYVLVLDLCLCWFAVVVQVAVGQIQLTQDLGVQYEHSSLQLWCTLQSNISDYVEWRRRSYGALVEITPLITMVNTNQCNYLSTTLPINMECSCRSREYTCIIKNLTRDQDGDQWRCVSGYPNGQEVSSRIVYLQIFVPISSVTMTSPASDNVRVLENSTQTFICQTSWVKPTAAVWWYKSLEASEVAIKNGIASSQSGHQDRTIQVTSSLTYTATRADNGYIVFCRATINGVDFVQSARKPQLDIMYPPPNGPVGVGFTAADVYKMIRGSQIQQHLTCYVSGGYPLPTLSWNCYGGTHNSSTQGNGVTGTVYWTAGVNVDSICTCTAQHLESGWTRTASVSVNVLFPPGVIECEVGSSRFTSGPVYVVRGSTFRIRCDSTSNPAPYNFTWTLPDGGTRVGRDLSVQNIQSVHTNKYKVTVHNNLVPSVGEVLMGTNSTILDIQLLYAPQIQSGFRIQGDTSTSRVNDSFISTVENSTFTLSFDVMPGYPTATTYTWHRRSGGKSTSTQGITFTNIKRTEADFYNFTAVNQMNPTGFGVETGKASIYVYIDVKYRSVITAFYADNVPGNLTIEAQEGTPLKLTCSTDSNPLPRITLTKNGLSVQEAASVRLLEYDKSSSSCAYDMGEYTCLSQNELNLFPEKITLHYFVLCAPRLSPFLQHVKNVSGRLHSYVDMSVTLIAFPAPTFTWQKLGESGWTAVNPSTRISIVKSDDQLQSNVSISDIQEEDFGSYRVVANNSQGGITIPLYFQASAYPNIPRYFIYTQNSHPETSASFYWLPGYNGGLTQTFYIEYKQATTDTWQVMSLVEDTTLQLMNITVKHLTPSTSYHARIYAKNTIGVSETTETIVFTTQQDVSAREKSVSQSGSIAGGVVAGVVVAVVIVAVVYLRLFYHVNCIKKGTTRKATAYEDISNRNETSNRVYEGLSLSSSRTDAATADYACDTQKTAYESLAPGLRTADDYSALHGPLPRDDTHNASARTYDIELQATSAYQNMGTDTTGRRQ